MGNMGHRPGVKGGYFPVNPVDDAQDLRSEMLSTMKRIGMKVDKHHHEVASCQHELGLIFGTLTEQADKLQKYKYVIHNVAQAYGKSATFMPKPIAGDNGTGMHVNMSIWKDGKPLFAGDKYADLSDEALYYIGGILKHAKALNAFTNPATNSYKRLIPGFEAPVLRAYSARNRSGCVRIPWTESPKAKRVEARFPDPSANPYLAFSALLMAGLDGIKNKIDPGEAMDKDLYDLPPEELAGIPTVCGSLREAMDELEDDHDFLLAGDVFTKDQIEGYMDAQVGRDLRVRAHAAPGRIQDVLQLLNQNGQGRMPPLPAHLLQFACLPADGRNMLGPSGPGQLPDRGQQQRRQRELDGVAQQEGREAPGQDRLVPAIELAEPEQPGNVDQRVADQQRQRHPQRRAVPAAPGQPPQRRNRQDVAHQVAAGAAEHVRGPSPRPKNREHVEAQRADQEVAEDRGEAEPRAIGRADRQHREGAHVHRHREPHGHLDLGQIASTSDAARDQSRLL